MRRLVFVPLLLAGCFYPADRGRLVEARLDKLASENRELQSQLEQSRLKLDETTKRLDNTLEQLDKAARRTDADIGIQLQKTVEDVATLRGQVETYQYRVAELETALKKSSDELEKRALAGQGADAVKAAEAEKKAKEMKRPDDPKEFLKLADDTSKTDKVLARTLYNELLKKWPKDPAAGEAHFGIGETYYSDEKCREALYEYGKVIQEFSKARSAPDAYLRSADCFKKLKMVAESKLALEEVVKAFPKSEAAKSAKTKLAELQKEKSPAPAPKGGKK